MLGPAQTVGWLSQVFWEGWGLFGGGKRSKKGDINGEGPKGVDVRHDRIIIIKKI